MTVHLDTSALIGALTGPRESFARLRQLVDAGHRPKLSTAACALVHEAALWTLNPKDFGDVPGLKLL